MLFPLLKADDEDEVVKRLFLMVFLPLPVNPNGAGEATNEVVDGAP